MSESELPEDLERWPQDDYVLLGINRDADERILKRAYARLIRKFKPEHHPQQFARIRAAYEAIQKRLAWISELRSPETDDPISIDDLNQLLKSPRETSPANSDPSSTPPSDGSPDQPPQISHIQRRQLRLNFDELIETAWKAACDGDTSRGYRELRMLLEQQPGNEEICLRLYWLSYLYPELAADLVRTHWLVECLRQNNLRGRTWELYQHELKRNPGLVESAEHISLTEIGLTLGSRIDEFLAVSWKAAVEMNRWGLIAANLNVCRQKLIEDQRVLWARLLFRAVEFAAWSDNPIARHILQRSRQDLDELTELQLELQDEFQRHDMTWELANSHRVESLRLISPDLAQLIRDLSFEPYETQRRRLRSILADWIHSPHAAVEMLDSLRRANPIAFHQLYSVIQRMDSEVPRNNDTGRHHQVNYQTRAFLEDRTSHKYARLRVELLDFCLENWITKEEVLTIIARYLPTNLWGDFSNSINKDLAIWTVLSGVAAFWA